MCNYGVSSDSPHVITSIMIFLDGKTSFSAHTDCNHNIKNKHYQSVLGGNVVKTVGCIPVDCGLVKEGKIPQEIWRVNNFTSDILVLQLASNKTITTVMSVVNIIDLGSAFALFSPFSSYDHFYLLLIRREE